MNSYITHGKTFSGTPTRMETVTEQRDGFTCIVRSCHLQGAASEYSWSVHRDGTQKTFANYRDGFAKTLRGAKRSVSQAITKLFTSEQAQGAARSNSLEDALGGLLENTK